MTSMRDVFVIAAACAADPAEALRQAIKKSGVNPARVQDLIFGADGSTFISADELSAQRRWIAWKDCCL